MKKFYIPYIVFCVLILILSVININAPVQKHPTKTKSVVTSESKISNNKTVENEKIPEEFYIIKASDNNIFLYDNNNTPIEQLNIDYHSLRDYDKNQILNGIKVNNMQDVYQLIEDFSN